MAALSSILGEPDGQRSLVGYSPWGRTESDTTERLSTLAHMGGKQRVICPPIPAGCL